MQIRLVVMSTQCATIPKDLTSAPAMRDFTKMDKTALVAIKYNCLLLSQLAHLSQPARTPLLNPLTSSFTVPG